MRRALKSIYRFLPVQLFFLHFRKYQLLLVFWLIILSTISGHFASHYGAAALFLAPEYLGHISFYSMLLLGGAMAVFVMAWHITTFIIHSKRMPYIGGTRHAFLIYCVNNSLLPLLALVYYSIVSIRFQWYQEHSPLSKIIALQFGFYLGFLFIIFISFAYFFRVGRDLLKRVISTITQPALLREFIPYDTLDLDNDFIHADTYLCDTLRIARLSTVEQYHPRLLATVLRRHHTNAVTATIVALVLLLLLGAFMDNHYLRIPAASGFLILFAVFIGIVGAVKHFLKSWELLGWIIFLSCISWLATIRVFDMRSIAYGINYKRPVAQQPVYDYPHLKQLFNPQRYEADKQQGITTLNNWKAHRTAEGDTSAPMVIISVSGGGLRSAYWTFRNLQYLDSTTNGQLFKHTVLVTGASGGMIGATYWRAIHAGKADTSKGLYQSHFQRAIGKDILNAIVFSLASVDLISPFNKITIAGYSYSKDRGYAMEQELISNSDNALNTRVADYATAETAGTIPSIIYNTTVINDGRKLMIAARPITYLTQPEYSLTDTVGAPIDAIDFNQFFATQDAGNIRTVTALRMNATFPFILPVVKLPAQPMINVMDAGLRDNFGMETATRYLHVFRDWINANTHQVILLQIRDTRENEVFAPSDQNTLGAMLSDPVFAIENKWEPFQSYYHSYVKDYLPAFLGSKLKTVSLQYIPKDEHRMAALNFHLTEDEKQDILNAVNRPENQQALNWLKQALIAK